MHRIERIRIQRVQLQVATLAARLRQRLQRSPEDAGLRRLLAALEAARPRPSLPLPGLPDPPAGTAGDGGAEQRRRAPGDRPVAPAQQARPG